MSDLLLLPEGWPRLLLLFVTLLPLLFLFLKRGSDDEGIPQPVTHDGKDLVKARPMRMPMRSIVLVARNERASLPTLLMDIEALLEREGSLLEVLLVDDRSTDNTAELLASFCEKHLAAHFHQFTGCNGKADCLRKAVPLCKGSQILFTDADCRLSSGWSRALGEALDSGWDLVGGPVLLEKADTSTLGRWQRCNWLLLSGIGLKTSQLGHSLSLWGGNLAFSRESVEELGGYEKLVTVHHNEDLVLCREMTRAGCKVGMFAPDADWIVRTQAVDDESLNRQLSRWLTGGLQLSWQGRTALFAGLAWFPALLVLGTIRPALLLFIGVIMLLSLHGFLLYMADRLQEDRPTQTDSLLYLLRWPPQLFSMLLALVRSGSRDHRAWRDRQ